MKCYKCPGKARIRDSYSLGTERRVRIECHKCGRYTVWIRQVVYFESLRKRRLSVASSTAKHAFDGVAVTYAPLK